MSYSYNPYEEADPPCALCGKDPYNCVCPECPECGGSGDPDCYDPVNGHGLVQSAEQLLGVEMLESWLNREETFSPIDEGLEDWVISTSKTFPIPKVISKCRQKK